MTSIGNERNHLTTDIAQINGHEKPWVQSLSLLKAKQNQCVHYEQLYANKLDNLYKWTNTLRDELTKVHSRALFIQEIAS